MNSRLTSAKLTALMLLIAFFVAQASAWTCPTCGCSELCPLSSLAEGTPESVDADSLLVNSIWGNIILKMAYQHDAELQRLSTRLKGAQTIGNVGLGSVAGGTLAQGVVAIKTLNPYDGLQDSTTPGIIGLGLEALTLTIFTVGPLVNHSIRHKVKIRQEIISDKVEAILHHLEYSDSECPNAQKELAVLIGERGARDCLQLWESSHVVRGELLPPKNLSSLRPATLPN